jgi:hypothetical protein
MLVKVCHVSKQSRRIEVSGWVEEGSQELYGAIKRGGYYNKIVMQMHILQFAQ